MRNPHEEYTIDLLSRQDCFDDEEIDQISTEIESGEFNQLFGFLRDIAAGDGSPTEGKLATIIHGLLRRLSVLERRLRELEQEPH